MKIETKKIGLVIAGVVVLAAVFYGGVIYGKSQIPARGQGSQALGQNGRGGMGGTRNGGTFGGMTAGEIISMDSQSITLKLRDGSSKIIFYTNKTPIEKNVSGIPSDLVVGKQVNVAGAANSDGSITAQTIQIRPQTTTPVVTPKP